MSAGEFCQNNMMDRAETRGARLDTLHHFIPAVFRYRRRNPGKRLVAFKSDVKSAFHCGRSSKSLPPTIPLVPRQRRKSTEACSSVVLTGDPVSVVGSPRLWSSVMGLVVWIALHERAISGLFAYVGDNFGFDEEGRQTFYLHYQKAM
ncbi:hypothetical protein B0H13DRAFT_2300221 [Mycena leptocephala]|nr:hypothetical protein B0H13DRAFT_2300221 [Mycena leptocephala]